MASDSVPARASRLLWAVRLLLCFDFIGCVSIDLFGVTNGKVTLNPSSDTLFKEITWKKEKDKVAEWYPGSAVRDFPPFQGRIYLNTTSGELTIFNLTSSDEDRYEIESQDLKENIVFSLFVTEPLPPPILNCTETDEHIVIQCMIPEHYSSHVDLIRYSWACSSAQCENNSNPKINFGKEHDLSEKIQCVLNNPVSKMESSITLRTCVPNDHSRHRWLPILAFVTALVIIIFALFGSGIWRCHRKKYTPSSS